MTLAVEIDREDDGCWIAEVPAVPGCLCYGPTREAAIRSVESLALRILAERIEAGDDSHAVREAFAVPV
jgi:predicted RNase H-like HicB family nuclease